MSNTTPQPPGRRLGYVLKQVQHSLRIKMDTTLKEIGLTTPQYSILCLIDADPGISNASLARSCFSTPQTTQEILANMDRLGLVERKQSEEHARILKTTMTRKGRTTLAKAHELVSELEVLLVQGLRESECEQLLQMLQRCASNLNAASE